MVDSKYRANLLASAHWRSELIAWVEFCFNHTHCCQFYENFYTYFFVKSIALRKQVFPFNFASKLFFVLFWFFALSPSYVSAQLQHTNTITYSCYWVRRQMLICIEYNYMAWISFVVHLFVLCLLVTWDCCCSNKTLFCNKAIKIQEASVTNGE